MQCLIKRDKADVGFPLLEAGPVQVFDHSGDTCFTVVVVTNITVLPVFGPSLFCFCTFACRCPIWQLHILTGV